MGDRNTRNIKEGMMWQWVVAVVTVTIAGYKWCDS